MSYWDDFKKRPTRDGREVGEVLRESGARLREDFRRARADFFRRDWSPEEARLELRKLQRALKRQEDITRPGSFGTFGHAVAEFLHGVSTDSEEFAYTIFSKSDLLAMGDFLEERIKEKPAPRGSDRDRLLEAAQDDRRRDRRWQAHESLGRVDDLRELRRARDEKLQTIERDGALSRAEKEEDIETLEQEYEARKQAIRSRSRTDIFDL